MTTEPAPRLDVAREKRRDALFNDLVELAIKDDEVSNSLLDTPGIDADYLRMRCTQEQERLWTDVAESAEMFDKAGDELDRRARWRGPFLWVYQAATSPQLQRLLALFSLASFVAAYIVSTPGPINAHPNKPLLYAVALVVTLAIVNTAAPRIVRRWILGGQRPLVGYLLTNPSGVTSMAALGALLFLTAIIWYVPSSPGKEGTHQTETFLWVTTITSAVFVISFLRRLNYDRSLPLTIDGRSLLIVSVGVFMPPTVSLLVINGGSREIATGQPNLLLLVIGLGLIGVAALLALAGLGSQPIAVVKDVYQRALSDVSTQLTELAILPLLRVEINNKAQSYEITIQVTEAPGLSQLSDPMYKVPTAASARVTALLKAMPGGSIGFAGSRGSGKTTLIESYCGGQHGDPATLATMVSAPVEYSAREFLLHLYAKICREVLGPDTGSALGVDPRTQIQRRRQRQSLGLYAFVLFTSGGALLIGPAMDIYISTPQFWGVGLLLAGVLITFQIVDSNARRSSGRLLHPTRSLAELAAERLEEIRFQQSFTSSWTGSVKAPVGLEGAMSGGRGLIRQQMHLPEIVDSLRNFLEIAAKERWVLIGIDELDKMKSDTAAEQFLNEIKSIFGVRGCYFLVSVSEDAMSNFERRGLPFRDVFDSTFDEIVWFEHLTPLEAIATIDRRVLLMPVPFKQLCFALSGGLPRDLIRMARMVIDVQNQGGPTDLSCVASRLVGEDVVRKTHAVAVAARQVDLEPDVSRFLLMCESVKDIEINSTRLRKLIADMCPVVTSRVQTDSRTESAARLLKLMNELACYYYYSATILDFFDTEAPETRWRTAIANQLEGPDHLIHLAKARQAFSMSVLVAWDAISRFRKAWGMTADPFLADLMPAAPQPH